MEAHGTQPPEASGSGHGPGAEPAAASPHGGLDAAAPLSPAGPAHELTVAEEEEGEGGVHGEHEGDGARVAWGDGPGDGALLCSSLCIEFHVYVLIFWMVFGVC